VTTSCSSSASPTAPAASSSSRPTARCAR
jgi:hypothetical protein